MVKKNEDGVWISKTKHIPKKGGYLPPGYDDGSTSIPEPEEDENLEDGLSFDEALLVFNLHEDVVGDLTFEHPFIDKVKNEVAQSIARGDRMNVYISSTDNDFEPQDLYRVSSFNKEKDLIIGKKSKNLLASVLEKRGVKKVTIIGCCITKKDAKSYVPKKVKVLEIDIHKKI